MTVITPESIAVLMRMRDEYANGAKKLRDTYAYSEDGPAIKEGERRAEAIQAALSALDKVGRYEKMLEPLPIRTQVICEDCHAIASWEKCLCRPEGPVDPMNHRGVLEAMLSMGIDGKAPWVPWNQQIKALRYALAALDDAGMFENACFFCSQPEDYGDPVRHHHEPEGWHWHHYLDPGDGLPSPCENSDLLERVAAEELSAFVRDVADAIDGDRDVVYPSQVITVMRRVLKERTEGRG